MQAKKVVKKVAKKAVKKVVDKSSLFAVVWAEEGNYMDAKSFTTLVAARAFVVKMKKLTDYRKPVKIAVYKKTV